MGVEAARRADRRPPERRPAPRRPPPAPSPTQNDRAAKLERRRRAQHFQRRRRDLLQDTALASALTIALVSATAGLGVLALIEMPVAAALIASLLIERAIRKRRTPNHRRAGRVSP